MNRISAVILLVALATLTGCLVPVGTYPSAESREFVVHKVVSGDTWDKLAAQYGVSVDELLFYNGYRWQNGDNWLFIGQELKVPLPVRFRQPSASRDAVVDEVPKSSEKSEESKADKAAIVEIEPNWIFQAPNGSDTQKGNPHDGQSVEIDQIPL